MTRCAVILLFCLCWLVICSAEDQDSATPSSVDTGNFFKYPDSNTFRPPANQFNFNQGYNFFFVFPADAARVGVNTAMRTYDSMNSLKSAFQYQAPSFIFQQPQAVFQPLPFKVLRGPAGDLANTARYQDYMQKLNDLSPASKFN